MTVKLNLISRKLLAFKIIVKANSLNNFFKNQLFLMAKFDIFVRNDQLLKSYFINILHSK